MPQVWSLPAETCLNRMPPLTGTGVALNVPIGVPSDPAPWFPQQYAIPAVVIAQACRPNVDNWTKRCSPGIRTGTALLTFTPNDAMPMRPSLPLSPQHQAMPPLAMSQACIVPTLNERYLMTTTRLAVPETPSLVAVTVTVPRSRPVSTPPWLSEATDVSDTVQLMLRSVSTRPRASRSVSCTCCTSNASSVSRD